MEATAEEFLTSEAAGLTRRVRTWAVHPSFDSMADIRRDLQQLLGAARMARYLNKGHHLTKEIETAIAGAELTVRDMQTIRDRVRAGIPIQQAIK
jgi:hypothetical protein